MRLMLALAVSLVSLFPVAAAGIAMVLIEKSVDLITTRESAARFRRICGTLLLIPPLGIVTLAALLMVFPTDLLLRSAHTTFLAGMWMTATVLLLLQGFVRRIQNRLVYAIALAGDVLLVAGIVYFTPVERFAALYDGYLSVYGLLAGLVMVIFDVMMLFAARRRLQNRMH